MCGVAMDIADHKKCKGDLKHIKTISKDSKIYKGFSIIYECSKCRNLVLIYDCDEEEEFENCYEHEGLEQCYESD